MKTIFIVLWKNQDKIYFKFHVAYVFKMHIICHCLKTILFFSWPCEACCLLSLLSCVALTLRGWMNRVHWHNCHCPIQFTNYPSCADCVLFMLRVLSELICESKWVINIKCGSITWSIRHIQSINIVQEAVLIMPQAVCLLFQFSKEVCCCCCFKGALYVYL